jgi:hypothetical protein
LWLSDRQGIYLEHLKESIIIILWGENFMKKLIFTLFCLYIVAFWLCLNTNAKLTFEQVALWKESGSRIYDVKVAGKYAYMAASNGLYIVDVSNPDKVSLTGFLKTTQGIGQGLFLSSNYVYLANSAMGLLIIDITNPTDPKQIGDIDTPGSANSVYVSGNYAYVADQLKGTRVIDVSNPRNPKEIGFYDPGGSTFDVFVADNYAYNACSGEGMRIIDISKPASPKEVGFYKATNTVRSVYVVGNYAYFTDGPNGFFIVNISDPANIVKLGNFKADESATDVYVDGWYAYVLYGDTSIRAIDVYDPKNPVESASLDPGVAYLYNVYVVNNYVYVASEAGLYIFKAFVEPFVSIEANPNSLPADGESKSTITVKVTDNQNRPLVNQDVALKVTSGLGKVNGAVDNKDGTYTASYTASTQVGKETVTATVSGKSKSVDITLTQISQEKRKLIIPEANSAPGNTVTVPINITYAAGVAGADIKVTYDSTVLAFKDCQKTTLTNDMNIAVNSNTAGEIVISMAKGSTGAITGGSGAFVNMMFDVNANAKENTETPVKFKEAIIYDALGKVIPADTQDGKVIIGTACVKGDVNGDGNIRANDAILALRISAGLMTPNARELCAADVNSDGNVRANDSILILRKSAGLAPKIMKCDISNQRVKVSLGEFQNSEGNIIVPLKVSQIEALSGGDINIAYDNSMLQVISISSEPNVMLAGNFAEAGTLRMSFVIDNGFNSQIIAKIKFKKISDGSSLLTFRNIDVYSSDAILLKSVGLDRKCVLSSQPDENALLQNFPNPFNPETWIPYQLKENSDVTLRIYNEFGKMIREFSLGYIPAGIYATPDKAIYWNGKNESGEKVASGIYFYTIQAGKFVSTKKMIVNK